MLSDTALHSYVSQVVNFKTAAIRVNTLLLAYTHKHGVHTLSLCLDRDQKIGTLLYAYE